MTVTSAYPDHTIIKSEGRMRCSCGRVVEATDVHIRPGEYLVVCASCHRDLLRIDHGREY
jgi:hypothetical protein